MHLAKLFISYSSKHIHIHIIIGYHFWIPLTFQHPSNSLISLICHITHLSYLSLSKLDFRCLYHFSYTIHDTTQSKQVICWCLKILENALLLQQSWLDEVDPQSHQPISACGVYSCTWTLEDLVQFWGQSRTLPTLLFLFCMAMHHLYHRLHKPHLVVQCVTIKVRIRNSRKTQPKGKNRNFLMPK